jgi:hypothetical protein
MKLPNKNEVDGETQQLIYLVTNGWSWQWPGWSWVAKMLNDEYKKNRSSASCRSKFYRDQVANSISVARDSDDTWISNTEQT